MMLDISVTRAKANAAAREFDNASCGPAGHERTRREKPVLSDRQHRTLGEFVELVTRARRAAFRDAAVTAACVAAADGFIDTMVLHEHGYVKFNSAGAVRAPRNERAPSWQSRAIRGVGR
jgi:hypothetical protein